MRIARCSEDERLLTAHRTGTGFRIGKAQGMLDTTRIVRPCMGLRDVLHMRDRPSVGPRTSPMRTVVTDRHGQRFHYAARRIRSIQPCGPARLRPARRVR